MSDLQKELLRSKVKLPPTQRKRNVPVRDYKPTHWKKYFESAQIVKTTDTDQFRVFTSGTPQKEMPLLVLLHGGGYSGLTWALFTKHIREMVDCAVVAIDLRGHGGTRTSDDFNLSEDTLSKDVQAVIHYYCSDVEVPKLLIGHSMGGAIAVRAASRGIPGLVGVVVIDVVETSALEALSSMHNFLKSRPANFKSLEQAIEWCVRSGQCRNIESAKVSMPGQLKNIETNLEAIEDIDDILEQADDSSVPTRITSKRFAFQSNLDTLNENVDSPTASKGHQVISPSLIPTYTWSIDLTKTEEYWHGWFSGLSSLFLSLSMPTILILAGVDRLDTELTVGQMQGKFQMQILDKCGHVVHEDQPDLVARIVASFLTRYHLATPIGDFEHVYPSC